MHPNGMRAFYYILGCQKTPSPMPLKCGEVFMPQRTIRFSDTTIKQIRQAAREKGSTSTAIVRHAVEQALSGSEEGVEQHLAATIEQIRGDLLRMQGFHQTLFAFIDTLAHKMRSRPIRRNPANTLQMKLLQLVRSYGRGSAHGE
jgi:DNA-binding GntR family transcriptional regulator